MIVIDNAAVGDRVYFAIEKRPYRVRARNQRYLICTKPFNPRKTVLYTIIDLVEKVRGPDNIIFGLGYEDQEDIDARLADLASGEAEVSHRRRIDLDVGRVVRP